MSFPFLIGLHGPIGSGKDTIANTLVDMLGCSHLKFADALYAMCHAIDEVFTPGMPHKDKDDYLLNNAAFGTRRNFIEKLGTEFGRQQIHPEFWSIITDMRIEQNMNKKVSTVISDVRFENEAEMIRNRSGVIIHLKPDWECKKTNHVSDTGIKYQPTDVIIGLEHGKIGKGVQEVLAVIEDYFYSHLLVPRI